MLPAPAVDGDGEAGHRRGFERGALLGEGDDFGFLGGASGLQVTVLHGEFVERGAQGGEVFGRWRERGLRFFSLRLSRRGSVIRIVYIRERSVPVFGQLGMVADQPGLHGAVGYF